MSATARVLPFPAAAQPIEASANESAKILKATLRAAFPKTKFSVTLSRGSMCYGYCSVGWTDGPTVARVDAIVDTFKGLRSSVTPDDSFEHTRATLPDGRRSGLRLINTSRTISPTFARRLAMQISIYYGADVVVLPAARDGWTVEQDSAGYAIAGEPWSTMMYRAAQDRTAFLPSHS